MLLFTVESRSQNIQHILLDAFYSIKIILFKQSAQGITLFQFDGSARRA